jgi:hypothetical protein
MSHAPRPVDRRAASNDRLIGYLEGKMEELLNGQNAIHERQDEHKSETRRLFEQLETRVMAQVDPLKVDAAEFRRIKALGMTLSAVVSVIFTIVGGFVATHWKHIIEAFR